jgi:tellurite resistance protein
MKGILITPSKKNRLMKERANYIPITLYAIVMGLTGLDIVFSKFAQLNWLPSYLYTAGLYVVSFLFVLISVLYVIKSIINFQEVVADFRHRIRINFFSAFSISLLLLSIAYHPTHHGISETLWWIGMAAQTFLMLHTIAFWIQHNIEIHQFNPAWFIPVVGNIIVPIMGVKYAPHELVFFYFAVGGFFWIILFTLFLNRVIFHDQLPQKFIPTLFILIAPPAVGFISYFQLMHQWDVIAEALVSLTYFFVLLLLFMTKSFKNLKFYISWWAFTFPLDALTIASALAYQVTKEPFYMYAAWIGFSLAVVFITMISIRTIGKIRHKEICVKED